MKGLHIRFLTAAVFALLLSAVSSAANGGSERFALKTNGLGLAGLIPNIGAEVYLGKNWSVSANWNHSWWHSDKSLWYWRMYGGDVSVRRWLGSHEAPLTGHHVGIYAQALTYDFLIGRRGIMCDKGSFGGGLEYGYSFPLKDCLRLDLALGVGYIAGEVKNYVPQDGHYVWQSTVMTHYIGPSKAEVSLVWLIDFEKWGGKRK